MSSRFNIAETPLAGLYRIDRNPVADHRGFFSRFFCAEEFKKMGLVTTIAQMNHTLTHQRGAIRGMHYQRPPHTETKIVTCIQGEILDVAIDIRAGSPTFLHWHSERLSAENQSSLYVPDGFAHGFQTMTDNCQLLYIHSSFYTPSAEGGLNALDPMLGIDWPLKVTDMSERDRNHPLLDSQFKGIEI
jgi:dTDP-4-dehydrorhamnose 3,5-epimerase